MAKESLTNEQFVVQLMNYSAQGALIQGWVLTALQKYAEQCVAAGPEVFDTPFMSGHAWVRCATEALQRLEEHLRSREGEAFARMAAAVVAKAQASPFVCNRYMRRVGTDICHICHQPRSAHQSPEE